jgi:hypothetical protein
VPDLEGSATLVAVMVTFCEALIVEGAVYRPFDTVPREGGRDQVTAVLVVPLTVAAN